MSKIAEIVSKAKSFANTNAGQVAVTGLSYMATLAICGGVAAKFFPGKATFGRALGLGIYAVGMQTLVGTAAACEQQQRLERSNGLVEDSSREVVRLRSEMFRLHKRLTEKAEELSDQERRFGALWEDLSGTVKYVHNLQNKLAEIQKTIVQDDEKIMDGENLVSILTRIEKLKADITTIIKDDLPQSQTEEELPSPPEVVLVLF